MTSWQHGVGWQECLTMDFSPRTKSQPQHTDFRAVAISRTKIGTHLPATPFQNFVGFFEISSLANSSCLQIKAHPVGWVTRTHMDQIITILHRRKTFYLPEQELFIFHWGWKVYCPIEIAVLIIYLSWSTWFKPFWEEVMTCAINLLWQI